MERTTLDERQKFILIGYALGRIRQQAGGFPNLLQLHNLVNKGLTKMYNKNFDISFDDVVEVFRTLEDTGILKFRTPEDWKKVEGKKEDGSASQGISR